MSIMRFLLLLQKKRYLFSKLKSQIQVPWPSCSKRTKSYQISSHPDYSSIGTERKLIRKVHWQWSVGQSYGTSRETQQNRNEMPAPSGSRWRKPLVLRRCTLCQAAGERRRRWRCAQSRDVVLTSRSRCRSLDGPWLEFERKTHGWEHDITQSPRLLGRRLSRRL